MLDLYKYTDKEKNELIKSMVILVDTREKSNAKILEFWDKKGIKYKSKKLDTCDYSFMIPKNESLNIPRDIYFDKKVCIERKGSLEEISGNMTNGRDRFEKELSLAPKEKILMIENASLNDIIDGNYDTKYNKKSFMAGLLTFYFRYDLPIFFMPSTEYSGIFIRLYFEYYLKTNVLK